MNISLRRLLVMDLRRVNDGKSGIALFIKSYFGDRGFRAVFYYRIANYFTHKGIRYVPTLIRSYSIGKTGSEIMPAAAIGPGLLIKHPVGIVIGKGVIIGSNCTISQNVTLGEKHLSGTAHKYPVIGDNVTICTGAIVIGDVEIGDNSIIGANSVINQNVPPNCVVAGIPGKIIKRL
jgi:serine O-acetyltransferase